MTSDREVRREKRYRRMGTREPACYRCGEDRDEALTGVQVCTECLAEDAGKPSTEAHHVAGRKNHPVTLELAANDHRVLSDRQRAWPKSTLSNPKQSRLLVAAACIRGVSDALRLLADEVLAWVPVFLEELDDSPSGKKKRPGKAASGEEDDK